MPGRRRRTEVFLQQSIFEEKYVSLAPTLNRFAEDTSMLGFRYLHAKYKTWFRVSWGVLITFFLGLTIYQVIERIGYYFVRNPLNTQRSYDNPSRVMFPTVLLCNKLQIKASRIARHSPELLGTMALMYNQDGSSSTDQTLRDSVASFDSLDFFRVFQDSLQTSEDFFLSCHYGRGQSCMDELRSVVTPNGLCFAVNSNITVERPGPETTLSILLNLETYETIPGWVVEPGVVLSMYDRSVPETAYSGEGMHLEAGKVVTIPINNIRKLHRHSSKCGKIRVGDYKEKDYSRIACQWHMTYEKISKLCGCLPIQSPKLMRAMLKKEDQMYLLGSPLSSTDTLFLFNNTCTLKDEFQCVNNVSKACENDLEVDSREQCPEDCSETTYTTIVFGSNLDINEIASYLPSDWDDDKEKRLNAFQGVFDIVPNHRIPLIRSIQKQAYEAQHFLDKALKLLGITEHMEKSILPCLKDEISYDITATIKKFHKNEPIWTYLAHYIETIFPFHVGSLLSLLGTDFDENFMLKASDVPQPKHFRRSKKSLFDKVSNVNYDIGLIVKAANSSDGIFGFQQLTPNAREALKRRILNLFTSLKECLIEKIASHGTEIDDAQLLQEECAQKFNSHYESIYVGREIPKLLSLETFESYANTVRKLTDALRDLKWNAKPKIFHWKHHKIDPKLFEILYMENGNDSKAIHDFLRHRKLIQSDIKQQINEAALQVESALKARIKFLEDMNLQPMAIDPVDSIRNSIQCLQNLSNSFELLKKSHFLRAEWTSRLQGSVTVAKSYSPGKQYDEVNLLFVKIYFAHFKQEIITQERSYSLFLLLAEIGGTIGLYVGASLLTIAETAMFFIEKKTRKSYKKRRISSSSIQPSV